MNCSEKKILDDVNVSLSCRYFPQNHPMSWRVTLPLLQLQETSVQRQTGNHSDQTSQLASGQMHSGFFLLLSVPCQVHALCLFQSTVATVTKPTAKDACVSPQSWNVSHLSISERMIGWLRLNKRAKCQGGKICLEGIGNRPQKRKTQRQLWDKKSWKGR